MELELKHLVAYLPFEIQILSKIESQIEHFKFEKCRLKSVNMLSKCVTVIHYVGINEDEEYITDKNFSDIKLALKPLSDLLFNEDQAVYQDFLSDFKEEIGGDWSEIMDEGVQHLFENYNSINTVHIEALPYSLATWLLSKHYDIFGLIEAKLAVDINWL